MSSPPLIEDPAQEWYPGVVQKAMGRTKIVLLFLALLGTLAQPACRLGVESPRRAGALEDLSTPMQALSTERMLADVARLSGPDMDGRQTGTRGDLASANYVAERFRKQSSPAGPDGRPLSAARPQLVPTPVSVPRIGQEASVELAVDERRKPLTIGTDFLPVLDSPSVDLVAPVVFVGYGIADPAGDFDEYANVDVRDRVVLFLRGTPPGYPRRWSHAQKERAARERGAVAFLTATGPIRSPYELRRGIPPGPLAYYGHPGSTGEQGLPGAWVSTDAAAWLVGGKRSLDTIQETINERLTPRSEALPALARLSWEADRPSGTLYNVVFRHPASEADTQPDTEAIVIGAHRDHFGRQAGLLFPGADDNASGTAVLLEVARVLRAADSRPLRALIFVSFSGEEQGLLGSREYIAQAAFPLDRTAAMINIDHVGVGNGRLTVGVAGLPEEIAKLAGQLAGLEDKIDVYGYFPGGDHVPFREADVPTVTVVSGGGHPNFHQPTDVPATVRPAVLEAVARYVVALVWLLAYSP